MASQNSVDISTAGGSAESSVNVSPQTLRVPTGSSVTFNDTNTGTPPASIQITFPRGVTCKVNGKAVSVLTVPVDGVVTATLEGSGTDGKYSVKSTWGDNVVTASPVIIIE